MARPVSFVKFVSFVDADRAAFIHRSVTWRVVGHSDKARMPLQSIASGSNGSPALGRWLYHPTRPAAPRTGKAREEARPEIAGAMLSVTIPTAPAHSRACGDGRLRRESARTAPIAERCHLGPAQRTAEQTCRKLSHLPDLTPIPLSRSSRARCRRPIPAPAGVVGRRAGGARIHDLRPHCLPPAQSYVEQWIGHLWSSFLLVIYWRKKNVPELSDFP